MRRYRTGTTYFLTEGKSNLSDCVRLSIKQAHRVGIPKVIMFTANGEGLELAYRQSNELIESKKVQLIGVSFAFGSVKNEALIVPKERQLLIDRLGIPILHAADPLEDLRHPKRVEKNLIQRALEFFSGGMALCIRAALIACDAGYVLPGEHVVSMSADTSVILKAAPSAYVFSTLSVREIICKPIVQDITKGESLAAEVNVEVLLQRRGSSQKALPASSKERPTPKLSGLR